MIITGVSHLHSTTSYDGKVSLSDLRRGLLERGMRFAFMTEHTDNLTSDVALSFIEKCELESDKSFLFIPGFEVPFDGGHVLIMGATLFIEGKSELDVIKAYVRGGALAVLAHPHRSNFEVPGHLADILFGIEIWNSQYDGMHVPRARSLKFLRDIRERHDQLRALGGIDFHRWEHVGGPKIEMDAYALTVSAVLESLRDGFYTIIGGHQVRISPQGVVAGPSSMMLALISAASVSLVSAGKKIASASKKMRIPVPGRIKQWLRKRL